MPHSYSIRKYSPQNWAEVKKITDDQLGKGYCKQADVEQAGNQAYIVVSGNNIVAFSYLRVRKVCELHVKVLSDYFRADRQVVELKSFAVTDAFKGKGIGHQMVKQIMHAGHHLGIKLFFTEAWKSKTMGIHSGRVLLKNGFTLIEEIPLRWHSESIKERYLCPECGYPCHCTAALFFKKIK